MMQHTQLSAKENATSLPGTATAGGNTAVYLADHRLESAAVQRKGFHRSNRIVQCAANDSLVQRKANSTGLPDNLKSGIENLSGHSMDDVKVHYNSSQPAQLNAHAYAQGNQIHVAPGQEKHVPHEAWHVVQQKEGRVKPTMQMKGKVNVNDDSSLEKEADAMGAKAQGVGQLSKKEHTLQRKSNVTHTAQLFAVGMVPTVPNNWRNFTNINFAGGTNGGAPFSNAQKVAVRNNNTNNAAGAAPVLAPGAYPQSDTNGGALITAVQANMHAPQVDHIVEAVNGGANDYRNARVLSMGQNNGNLPLGGGRPNRTQQRMKAYHAITITALGGAPPFVGAAAGAIAAGGQFTMPQIQALTTYAGVGFPHNYAAINNGMIAGIQGAVPGIHGTIQVT